jgi:protein involved in polysaccharide export with SLBB domain
MSGAGVKVAWGWVSGRAERERVACEVREEMGFHISKLEEELGAQGLEVGEVRARCRARFGDAERFVREGERIKSGDTIMLQRINLGLLVVMVVAVVVVALRMSVAQQRSLAAIEKVSARLEEVGQVVARRAPAPAETETGLVYISGEVARPGPYQLPISGLTLRRALDSAGGYGGRGPIAVYHKYDGHEGVTTISAEEFSEGTHDFDLSPNDRIVAGERSAAPKAKAKEGPSVAAVVAGGEQDGAQPVTPRPVAYVSGAIKEPGPYYIPHEGLTLRQLLGSGGNDGTGHGAVIRHKDSNGQATVTKITAEQLADPAGPDPAIEAGDIVTVE